MSQYGIIMPQAPAHFTHPRLHIRTAQDAHRVFEAVRLGILPLIRRRLSPSERDLLASGQVFVWEEAPTGSAAGDEASATTSGLERWTDGRRWSQSRMREPFLFYEEKVQTTPEEKQAKAERRARKASSSDSTNVPSLLPVRRQDRPSKPDGLTKQTYSSFVHLPPNSQSGSSSSTGGQPRKWHCVAYFSAVDWNNLPGVEAYPDLRNIVIPDNVYTSTKGTGKTGAPLAMSTPSSSSDVGGNSGSVGPTRRPLSRGEHSSSPYSASGPSGSTPTLRARQYSFGSSSDASSSYQPRSPSSAYDSPASYSYQSPPPPVPALPQQHQQQQQHKQLFHPHHQHTSSTSSNSTGSPPTPGFMAPIPSPASFANQSPSYPPTARPFPESRKSFGGTSSSSGYNDVVMADAPTLRTPTKEHPPQSHHNDYDSRNGYFTNGNSAQVSAAPTAQQQQQQQQQAGGNAKLPSLPSLLGQNWTGSSSGRSREDSKALGAFRLAL